MHQTDIKSFVQSTFSKNSQKY